MTGRSLPGVAVPLLKKYLFWCRSMRASNGPRVLDYFMEVVIFQKINQRLIVSFIATITHVTGESITQFPNLMIEIHHSIFTYLLYDPGPLPGT